MRIRLRETALVAEREVRYRLRDRASQISALIGVGIIVVFVVIAAASGGDDARIVAVADAPAGYGAAVVEAGAAAGVEVTVREVTAGAAEALVRDGDASAAVVGGRLLTRGTPDATVAALLQGTWRAARGSEVLAQAGVDEATAAAALAPQPLAQVSLDPLAERRDERSGVAFAAVIVLYGQLFAFGIAVASGIVEEKQSRIAEVLTSTLRPAELLLGKIAGIGVVGLLQILATAAVGLAAARLADVVVVDGAVLRIALGVVAWFVLGYLLFATLFACAGALASRTEDLQATSTPISLVVVAGFFAALQALASPDGTIAHVASLLPLTSAMAMPVRQAAGDVPAWEIGLAVVLVLLLVALLVPLAARIYRGGLLHTTGRLRLGAALERARRA